MGGINLNIAAFSIQITCIVIYLSRSKLFITETRIFFRVLVICLLTVIFDTLSVVSYWFAPNLPFWLLYSINLLYFYFYNTVPLFVVQFITSLGRRVPSNIFDKYLWLLPWIISIVLISSSPWTGFIFSFDTNKIYSRGPYQPFLYFIAFYFVILSIVYFIQDRKIIPLKTLISVYFFLPLSIIPLIIQFLRPELLITNFFIGLSELIILFTILDFGEFIDHGTNIFNKNGLLTQIDVYRKKNNSFTAILLCLDNESFIRQALGIEDYSKLQPLIVIKVLRNINDQCFCAQFEQGKYVQITSDSETADQIIQTIIDFFSNPVCFENKELQISVRLCKIEYPSDANEISSIYRAMYLLSRNGILYPLNTVLSAKDVFKDQETRRILVLSKLRKALIDNSFIMYFQPIVDTQTNEMVSAEALIRFKDPELGWISPAEFIPIAEQAGIINTIGNLVMNKSCQLLSSIRANGYNLEYIEINLSPVQCLQNNLAQEMLYIVESYGLKASDICFEITETATSSSKEFVQTTIEQLKSAGFLLAIDDYGTGYSNMLNLLAVDFNYIKIDRSILLSAENSNKGLKALNAIVALFNPLSVKMVAEGVETENQLAIIKATEIQYIQGFYYSRPLSPDDFLDYLSKIEKGIE